MQVINKKIIVIFICLSIFIFGLFKLFNKEKVVLDNVILDIKDTNNSFAIYIEKYDAEGNASYVESEDSIFPIEDYVYNKELSGCLDSNSNEVEDALNYNYVDKELNLRVNKPVTCYVYYDYKGNGTEKIPYKIRSIEDLLDLSLKVNSGTTYANEYFELTRDLDFRDSNSYNDSERTDYGNLNGIEDNNTLMEELTTGTGWIPIGKYVGTLSFQGIFDGNDKKINNLFIEEKTRTDYHTGLFALINNSEIKNLTVSGNIYRLIGGVSGGIVSLVTGNSVIDNCHSEVNIENEATSNSAGGIVGELLAGGTLTIKNSSNKGNISGSNNTGGLIGLNFNNLKIENSHNEGTVTNSLGLYTAGLLGRDYTATSTTTILNSYNSGKVIIDGTDRSANSGGLIGKLNGNAHINNSYNKGEINVNIDATAGQVSSGGLIGYDDGKVIMTNSHNEGNVMGGNRVGGLVGIGWNNSVTIIDKSYNTGNLAPSENSNWNGSVHVGGITSYVWNGAKMYLFNSYNSGNVEANSSLKKGNAGFITSISGDTEDNQKVIILNSYNIGDILNGNMGFGFSGLSKGTLKLNNIYNMGDFKDVTTKCGIGYFTIGQPYDVKKAYYKNNISGSNIENNEIVGKELNYMQSDAFVTELNNNLSSITISDYIDNDLLTEFKNTTGYDLTLSKWTLKDGHPVLVF